MKKARIGIIGLGGIAQGIHIPNLIANSDCEITAVCDIDTEKLNTVSDRLGIDESHRFTDYRDLIACPDVDAVEICTPNYLHVPMAVEVVNAGKAINIEKPLSIDLAHTVPLQEALSKHPVPNMMCFSYRFNPAIRFAKWIIEKGALGKIISVNIEYLKSSGLWEGRRLEWRFIKEYAGTGVLGDLGVHLIDATEFLIGKIHSVSAKTGIVVKERKRLDSDEAGKVETDDYCNFIAELDDNVAASFVISRCAIGNGNTIKFDIFGADGVISFNLNDPYVLSVCLGEIDKKTDGLHQVRVPNEFYTNQEDTFVNLVNGKIGEHLPTISDGIRCQQILDCLLTSAEEKRWVNIPQGE